MGVKRSKYHYITITKSISKIVIPKIVCGLTKKRYKTYKTGFLFSCLGHTPEDLGAPGCPGVKKMNMAVCHIKLTGMESRTECKYNFYPRVKLVTLG